MHVKYFQALADIRNHYDEILRCFRNSQFALMLLESWGIDPSEKELILEEREALRYLIGCQLMLVHDKNAKKPTIEVVNRCLNRHLVFLEKIHNCHVYNVNKHRSKFIQKQYKACRHYLFKFSLPAWYEKLPAEILTFENKYPHRKEWITKHGLQKGDFVVFIIGQDENVYTVIKDEYEFAGRRVVDLEGYSGEVAVEYLDKINS